MGEAIATRSFEDFLAAEQLAERRHELVGGRIYAMAGGSERHDLVAGLIYELVAPVARARACRPFTYATEFGDIDVDAVYDILDRTATTS